MSPTKAHSIKSYHEIVEEGKEQTQAGYILSILAKGDPMSSQMIRRVMPDGTDIRSVTARVRRLVLDGLVQEASEGLCPITGKTVSFWTLTDEAFADARGVA